MNRILAIVVLRLKMTARAMRGSSGKLDALGGVLLFLLGGLVSLGLGTGLGILVHFGTLEPQPRALRASLMAVFFVCAFFGLALPALRGAMDQGFDAAPFRIYPFTRRRLFGITLAAAFGSSEHLLYYPTLLAVTIVAVLLAGVGLLPGLTLMLLLLLFYVAWSNALTLFLVSIMRARRVKEILALVAFTLLIGVSFAPALLDSATGKPTEELGRVNIDLRPILPLIDTLPPALAASGLTALHHPDAGYDVTRSVAGLALWDLAGVLLGYFVFVRFHIGSVRVGSSPSADRADAPAEPSGPARMFSFDGPLLGRLPAQIRAVAAKDLHYLLRSVVGKFNLFVGPVFVLLVAFVIGDLVDEPILGIDPERLLLFGLMFYSVLFSNNFVNNAFAWEGDGIKAYYTSPTPLRRVIVGKNLAVWLYNAVLFGLIGTTWLLTMGLPDPITLISATLLFATAILFFTGWGNVVSVLFPVRRDMSSMGNAPSQIAVLLSMGAMLLMVLVLGPFLSIPLVLGWHWLQPLALAGLLLGMVGVYLLSLKISVAQLDERRDRIIETLRAPR